MSRACPICKQPVVPDAEHRPFCSARCQNVDLGHWLGESYRISRPLNPEEVEENMDAIMAAGQARGGGD